MALRRALPVALAILAVAPGLFAATFTVNTVVDAPDASPGNGVCLTASGTCSLRAAIQEANTTQALDTIAFAIPGPGVHTIVTTGLPYAYTPLIVDGFTQPGSQPNTNATGGLNSVLTIELAGGLNIFGDGSTARGLVINGGALEFGSAINGPIVVEGCYVGTDTTGTQSRSSGWGIRILDSGGPARIGGTLPWQRNLLSGNSNTSGIYLACPYADAVCNPGTVIQGNLIGTTVNGIAPLPNAIGVDSLSSGGLTIGGSSPAARNVISGNDVAGVYYAGNGRTGVVRIQGNRIGVDDSGGIAIPNQMGIGVGFDCYLGCTTAGSPIVEIGGSPATANLIARNSFEGISVSAGTINVTYNSIVTNADGIFLETISSHPITGTIADNTISDNRWYGIEGDALAAPAAVTLVRNTIRRNTFAGVALTGSFRGSLYGNAISDNGRLGIDLGDDGVTPNDPLDQDTGPNDRMNFPVVSRACSVGGVVTVEGTLNTRPSATAIVELFVNASCDPSAHGEGAFPQTAQVVTTDAAGNAAFSIAYPGVNGNFLTATATSAAGDTSEFGRCVPVAATPPPPQAITGPSLVCAGTRFVLRASGGGGTYQWFRDGIPISGATGVTYARPAAAITDGGNYTVRASACGLDTTSPPFSLTVVNCEAFPLALDVDRHAASGTASDVNGVIEPGETVLIEPRYRIDNATPVTISATATLSGPAGGAYFLPDNAANYGTVAPTQVTDCFTATGDCYRAVVSAPSRPVLHWDATLIETMTGTPDPPREWTVHIGETFSDVPRANSFYRFVEALVHNGVTGGCTTNAFCPAAATQRQQMAVFVLVAREPAGYAPPACNPAALRFSDVPASSPYCRWIEELARRNVVGGCSTGTYCPLTNVAREQMAVFVLAAREASGYVPPPCVAGTEVFDDVRATSPYCRWIEELARRHVVSGCGNRNYCPLAPVTRGEMSVFVVATFGLLLYGP
jgi:CSLREA domain-containing protein